MKKHVKIYLNSMGYSDTDWIPCEVCEKTAVDIHHIYRRGMGGNSDADEISNLMALCRHCHVTYGDYPYLVHSLQEIHDRWMKIKGCEKKE